MAASHQIQKPKGFKSPVPREFVLLATSCGFDDAATVGRASKATATTRNRASIVFLIFSTSYLLGYSMSRRPSSALCPKKRCRARKKAEWARVTPSNAAVVRSGFNGAGILGLNLIAQAEGYRWRMGSG